MNNPPEGERAVRSDVANPTSFNSLSSDSFGTDTTIDLVAGKQTPGETKSVGHAVETPRRLGRFELGMRLGGGGFGVVYRAYDPRLQREVAVKVARPDRLLEPEDYDYFFREARAAAQFQHPGIVPVLEVGREGQAAFIVAPLVEGESLDKVIARRRFTVRESVEIVLQLADALHYAHLRGVLHRDIKPANALLDDEGKAFLMDFGLARRSQGESLRTQQGDVLGTPAYMSPEQVLGRHDLMDVRSDLYGLGLVLYEMVCGKRAFEGEPLDILEKVRAAAIEPPRRWNRGVSHDLEAILLKALAPTPEQRYPSVQHFADDLRRWRDGLPVQARRVGFAAKSMKWVRRHPTAAAILFVVGVAMIGGGVYWNTRPCYLDLRVAPVGTAYTVRVGEQLVELDAEGRAVITTSPGRSRLSVTAEDFESAERELLLVRGKENTNVASIVMTPRFGYLAVSTSPPGADCKLRNAQGEIVAAGMSPFHTPRLRSGRYKLEVSKALYASVEREAEIRTGDQLHALEAIELTPLTKETSSYDFFKGVRKGMERFVTLKANMATLPEITADLKKQTGIDFLLDPRGLEDAGIQVERTTFSIDAEDIPLRPLMLRLLDAHGLDWIPVQEGSRFAVKITSKEQVWSDLLTVAYPVADIVPGNDYDSLIDAITTSISPESWIDNGGRGTIQTEPRFQLLVAVTSFGNHEKIDALLDQHRQRALATDRQAESAEKIAAKRLEPWGKAVFKGDSVTAFQATNLDFSDRQLESLAEFPNLASLTLIGCAVEGTSFDRLQSCKKLTAVFLSNSFLTDDGMERLTRLSSIKTLQLDGTRITDRGLEQLHRFPGLSWLVLSRTKISDAALEHVSKCKNINSLYLTDCAITDDGVSRLAELKGLQRIDLAGTQVTNRGIASLAPCTQLLHAELSRCPIGDEGLKALRRFDRLQYAGLGGCGIGDDGVRALVDFPALTNLYLSGEQVMPQGLAALGKSRMWNLQLSKALLNAEATKGLASLQNLRSLQLTDCRVEPGAFEELGDSPSLMFVSILGAPLDAAAIQGLAKIKSLRNLTVNADTSIERLAELRSLRPDVRVHRAYSPAR